MSVSKDTDSEGESARDRGDVREAVDRLDEFQQRHRWLAVPVAVVRKFAEDQSTNLASMIAFWAFFSLFPLFLVFVTLLGFLLPATVKGKVLEHVASMFPLVDTSALHGLSGSWWALIVGLASALWSGLAVVRTAEVAFNAVWEIPYVKRPGLVSQILRAVGVLATIGLGLVASTLITGFVSGDSTGVDLGWLGRAGGFAVAVVVDVGLFVAAFRILTNRKITIRQVLPGAVLSGALFWVLQSLSSLIITRYLHNAQSTYGHFATVITILWWFYLQSLITLLGAQLNTVLTERLHPRGLSGVPDTEADERAYDAYAKERTYHDEERVEADFPETDRRTEGDR
jgi:YihY family inner membrane protein